VQKTRPALFRGRHFKDQVIILCVRWYLRYCLTLRDLEEMMAERGLAVDHSTIGRWVLRYAPELHKRIRRELRPPNRSWRVDETYVRVAGTWTYLYRAVDSTGATIDFMLSPKRDLVAANSPGYSVIRTLRNCTVPQRCARERRRRWEPMGRPD
jgi:transposase-like protein